jgi:AcrR family transcriptional regulator
LLAAGLDLVAERAVGDALDHLRVNDLAHEAGVTSGAFYHYWNGQDDYRRAVLNALLTGDRLEAQPGFVSGFGCGAAADGASTLAAVAEHTFVQVAADRNHRMMLGLWAQQDAVAHQALARRADRLDAAWAARLGHFLAPRSRTPRPPWTLNRLGAAVTALTDGLVVQGHTTPAAIAPGVPGLLAQCLVIGATEAGELTESATEPEAIVAPEMANDRQQRLVEVGVAAALARPVGNALDHIRAQDVVHHLGLTVGAFYHYWESQEDYRDDLVDALFAASRYVEPTELAGLGAELAQADGFDEAVRDGTTWYWDLASDHPDNRVQFGFIALDDPYITPRLGERDRQLRTAWEEVLRTVLARFGRAPRPPLDDEILVLGMGAAIDGLILRHGLGGVDLGPDGEGWTAWGRICSALLAAGTVGPDEDAVELGAIARQELQASA